MTKFIIKVRDNENFWEEVSNGWWEKNCFNYLLSLVKNMRGHSVILDIGAWVGPFTLFFSKIFREEGRVYAFEPDSEAFNKLKRNIKINKCNNIYVENLGLSNISGRDKLYFYGGGGSSGSFLKSLNFRKDDMKYSEESIELTTIDDYCKSHNIKPSGIEIDVEGAEALVIEGGMETITKYSPWVLLEFHGLFMSEEVRIKNWERIVKNAQKIVYIDGNTEEYKVGDIIKDRPKCLYNKKIKMNLMIYY